jgi:transcriptional regulator with XRE-family HTH domain
VTPRPRRARNHPTPVSDRLRSILTEGGRTPYAVAVAAGLAPSVLSRFARGERSLSLDSFDRIAAALGLKLVEGSRRRSPAAMGVDLRATPAAGPPGVGVPHQPLQDRPVHRAEEAGGLEGV